MREATFDDGGRPDGVYTITAHADCIQIHFGDAFAEQVVTLEPRHIDAIVAMHSDWWASHWAKVHEAAA